MSKYDPTGDSDEAQYTQHIATISGMLNEAAVAPYTPDGYISGLSSLQGQLKEAHRTLGTDEQWQHHELAVRALHSIYMVARNGFHSHFLPIDRINQSLGRMRSAYSKQKSQGQE
jgi:hypothetical protein